jgi:long-chain-fatty-acid---luciferin-component ligase
VDFLHPTTFYVERDVFRPEQLLGDLLALDREVQPLLVGPPFLVAELAGHAISQGSRLRLAERDALVITAGGWKRFQATALSREEIDACLIEGLGVAPGQVRDAFNMVELNTVLFECSSKKKHVPPWLFASAREPVSLAPRSGGEEGLLAFCDPAARSYPCFILTDDVGAVSDEHRCDCGRWGHTLEITRRVARVEARGCALKMDRTLAVHAGTEGGS